MADYNSGLPVRTQADGTDERLHVKIVDKTNPTTQQATVDTDSNVHVEAHGDNPTGGDETMRMSELGHPAIDGVRHASDNTDPSNIGLIVCNRSGAPTDTDQVKRITGISSSDRHALDVALLDESGNPFDTLNPLPVSVESSGGVERQEFSPFTSVAASASVNHDITVTGGKTLHFFQSFSSASGKLGTVVRIETGVATGIFNDLAVGFNSTANPNIDIKFSNAVQVSAGFRVRITLTNRDNQSQNLYSTISGVEIP